MPQMFPLNWMMLLLFFIIIFTLFNIQFFFISKNKSSFINKSLNFNKNHLNWKW
nr:ATP synthase F0 subunit 8 [Hemathlophorus sp.]